LFVNNCKFELKWNIWDLFRNLRTIALKTDVFNDLKYNPKNYLCLFLINLLHIEKFTGRVEFENTST